MCWDLGPQSGGAKVVETLRQSLGKVPRGWASTLKNGLMPVSPVGWVLQEWICSCQSYKGGSPHIFVSLACFSVSRFAYPHCCGPAKNVGAMLFGLPGHHNCEPYKLLSWEMPFLIALWNGLKTIFTTTLWVWKKFLHLTERLHNLPKVTLKGLDYKLGL